MITREDISVQPPVKDGKLFMPALGAAIVETSMPT
jgi:hypothetical protein